MNAMGPYVKSSEYLAIPKNNGHEVPTGLSPIIFQT